MRTRPPQVLCSAAGAPGAVLLAMLAMLTVTLSHIPIAHAARAPHVQLNWFDRLPARVEYFNDSSSVLWHSKADGRLYHSPDEGATWAPVSAIPAGRAQHLVLHPYDKTAAYVLSSGTDHWRTADAGRTWHPWTSPVPPVLASQPPLSFNADYARWDDIIFLGNKCTSTGWLGGRCVQQVRLSLSSLGFFPPLHIPSDAASPIMQVFHFYTLLRGSSLTSPIIFHRLRSPTRFMLLIRHTLPPTGFSLSCA